MKNTTKNEARTSLMTTLTAVRTARKDAKVKLMEKIEAAYAEYRKLVADLKAERTAAIDKYLAAKNETEKPVKKAAKKAAEKAAETAAEKAA